MALPPHLADLEGRLASRVEDAMAGFRRAIEARLRDASERLLAEASAVSAPSIDGLLTELERDALDDVPRREGARNAAAALLDAARDFDRAGTQGEVLRALLEACRRQGDRAALFLVRGERVVLFDGAGFDPALLQGAEASLAAFGAEADAIASGCLELGAGATLALRSELDLPPGGSACVVPLVLRDRIAALLWADRSAGAPELAPLQLLTHLAAQRLELQALSERAATATLYPAGASAAPLPLWSAAVAEPAEPEPVAVTEPEIPAAPLLASALAFEMVGEESATSTISEPEAQAIEPVEPEVAAEEPALEFAPAPPEAETGEEPSASESTPAEVAPPRAWWAAPVAEPELRIEPEPEVELAQRFEPEPVLAVEPVFEPVAEPEPAPIELAAEPEPEPAHGTLELAPVVGEWGETPPVSVEFEPIAEPLVEAEPDSEPAPEPVAPAPPVQDDYDLLATTRLQIPSFARFEPPPAPAEPTAPHLFEAAAPPEPMAEPEPAGVVTHEFEATALTPLAPEPDPTEDATLLTQRFTIFPQPAAPEPEPPPAPSLVTPPPTPAFGTIATPLPPLSVPAAPPAAAPAPVEDPMDRTSSRTRSTEVAPPPDLQGPGRAFQGIKQRAAADSPTHEEAKRLARLLISEIKLYNEEQVLEGRRNRDLYHRLKEDIDRSRQIYEERVDPGVRTGTDYFHQELVRSLAGGDARALGI